ncbi:MAG: S-adenosyl-l-methionine hydroxide adenosyltransferase family protein [Pyrinomonadaceae bacterium]
MSSGKEESDFSQLAADSLPIITLLTDFGVTDHFVASVKGVILSTNPRSHLVDITHDIPSQDIEAAAFTLLAVYKSFPTGTIHLAVVDPGVGSSRRAIAVRTRDQYFVGPDNGIFSYIYETEPAHTTVHVTNETFFNHPVSTTFHGRDIFGPVAAALSKGVSLDSFGPVVTDEMRLSSFQPQRRTTGALEGRILHIDRFGNCITNVTREALGNLSRYAVVINETRITSLRAFYSDELVNGKLFAVWGSAGFLEICVRNASAAELLNAKCGQAITIEENDVHL